MGSGVLKLHPSTIETTEVAGFQGPRVPGPDRGPGLVPAPPGPPGRGRRAGSPGPRRPGFFASLALAMATYFLRAWRWMWILRPAGRVRFGPAFYATAVGFAGNFLPARAGEIIRPALLSRDTGLPFSTLLASILFERLLDAASVFFFLGLAMLEKPWARATGSSAVPVGIGVLPLVALGGIVTLSYLAVFHRPQLERLTDALLLLVPRSVAGVGAVRAPGVPGRLRPRAEADRLAVAPGRRRLAASCGSSSTCRSRAS